PPGRSEARKLLGLAYPERRRLAAAVGFLAASSVITMSAPFFLGKVIDVIYTDPTADFDSDLARLCLPLSGLFLCGAAANAVRVYLMQTSGQRIVNRLRVSLFTAMLKQEVAFFDKTHTGELVNRLSADTVLLGRSVTENLSDGLRAVAQASVGSGMMFFVSPHLAAFVLSVVPPVSILAVLYGRYLRKLSKRTQDSLAQATQLAEERIGNIRTVRAFGKEMAEVETYTRKVDDVMQLARRAAFAQAGFFGVVSTSFWKGRKGQVFSVAGPAIGFLGDLAVGFPGDLVVSFPGDLAVGFPGDLLVGFPGDLANQPRKVAAGDGRASERQNQAATEVGGRCVLVRADTSGLAPSRFEYTFHLQSGVQNLPTGPYSGPAAIGDPFFSSPQGTIRLDGHDIRQLNPVWLRSKIGTVSQEPILFSCSIAENIAYGADDPSLVTAEQVERVADVANATAFIRSFPQGFSTVVGEKGVLLSGGQKQRIAVARALLKNPKILLLDEATSALDAENEHLVQEALDRLMEGRTVLIIAHRLSTIKNADVVAVLDQGRITEYGKHEDLLSNPDGMYRKLMNKQSTSW
ncbi:ATP-binding cassette sub-family B member 10, mitochondrial, partial [Pteropus alecto]|uniref:ATP-binding cassette sub-family B member 10, mitochondrial n=1 Tax=Pteropus alecto TaxID=9402 RepID=UPI000D532EC3